MSEEKRPIREATPKLSNEKKAILRVHGLEITHELPHDCADI